MGYSSMMRSRMGYPHHVRRLGMNRSVRRRNSRLRMSNFGELGDQEGLRALCMVNLLSLALCFIVDGIWFYSMGKFVISERIVKGRVRNGEGQITGRFARPPMPCSYLNLFRDDFIDIVKNKTTKNYHVHAKFVSCVSHCCKSLTISSSLI